MSEHSDPMTAKEQEAIRILQDAANILFRDVNAIRGCQNWIERSLMISTACERVKQNAGLASREMAKP